MRSPLSKNFTIFLKFIAILFLFILFLFNFCFAELELKHPIKLTLSEKNYSTDHPFVTLKLEIKEDWKVYSHDPGESGLPLNIIFKNIRNIKSYDIDWPKPNLITENGMKVYVYENNTIIPIKITAIDNTQPINSQIMISYGACNEYCIKGSEVIDLMLTTSESTTNPLWWIILCAILGGFILNLMPCVLPVLSLKLFSLMKNIGAESSKIRISVVYIILGILFSFILMAIITETLKVLGHSVGWGFHFQEPAFIIFIIIVLIIFANNLWGNFEISTPKFLNNISYNSDHYIGSFFSGAFATLLATPCTAPFLSVAIAFGLSQGFYYLLIMYFFIGIGMALPFIALLISPKLLNLMPKPGKWMITLKKVLAVFLLLTAIWLLYILSLQLGYKAVLILLGSILITKFILTLPIWKTYPSLQILAIITVIIISTLLTLAMEHIEISHESQADTMWEEFSEQKINEYLHQGHVILVDITAEWCLICKMNKVMVWNHDDVLHLLQKHNVKLLQGDYTTKSPIIQLYLQKNNHPGIPLNIIYSKEFPEGIVLPSRLNKEIVYEKFTEITKNKISTKSHVGNQ